MERMGGGMSSSRVGAPFAVLKYLVMGKEVKI